MMKPSKQESVSRQSSILKAPKQRQPLQCVATNPSSSENSPTVKIKRRVSFAKNRRIRQFCNEAEQETVWDNTYEEHDSSHTKSNSCGSPDKPLIISVPSDDKENFPVQLFLKDNQLDCKEVPANVPIEEGDNLSQCDMEMDESLINPELGKALPQDENEVPNATIYCDDGMDMTSYVPANIIPCRNVNASLEDTALVSQTCIQDTSMELTENIPHTLSENFNQEQNKKYSTDLTQALSKLLGAGRLTKQTHNVLLREGSESTDTVPVEFPSILPSSTWIKPNTPCPYNENTENFSNKTMEFTAAVPRNNIQSNANNQKLNNKTRLSEKTEIFSNKSMEITEAVPVLNKVLLNNSNLKLDNQNLIQEKTEIFCNKSMEMTEAISNYNKKLYSEEKTRILNTSMEMTEIPTRSNIQHLSANLHDATQEKTNIFPNKSMEVTEVIPAYNKNSNIHNVNSHVFRGKEDKTEVFYNKSMEMTEAVPVSNKNLQYENAKEKTRVFFDKSMEITDTIAHKLYQPGADKIDNNRDMFEEKTTIFPNVSMEMTEAVLANKFNKTDENKKSQDKTNVFVNKSMEMTDIVPAYTNINQINELNQNKTKIFCNKSMEITEPVYLCKHTDGGLQEKAEIFANKSMEITEAIPGGNRLMQFNTSVELTEAVPKNIQQLISQKDRSLHEDRTRMFANKSMDVTETVPINPIISNIHEIQNHNAAEKIKIFNKSAELTQGIPVNHKLFEQKCYMNEEKTEHFINKSMDITEAIAINHRPFESKDLPEQNLNEEKTEYFLNKSMDITEAIPRNLGPFAPPELTKQVLNEEKTEYFLNKSMDITEAIPRNLGPFAPPELAKQVLNEEKTEYFLNKSMDITEAIPRNRGPFAPPELPKQVLNEEKTEYFLNKSMDITEAIPRNLRPFASLELSKQVMNDEKTEYFLNKSMEITEAIPVNHRPFKSKELPKHYLNDDKTEHFINKSMDITEAIPAFTSKEVPKQDLNEEKTEYFINKSINITESVPMQRNTISNINLNGHNNLQKPRIISNIPIADKTNYFTNKSMEITEAVAANQNDQFSFITNTKQITQNKTKVFLDKSMDMTETIPINQQVLKTKLNNQSNLKTHEKTKIFMDNSMDMTEAIIAGINNFISNEKVNEIPLNVSKDSKSNKSDINSRPSLHINTEASSKSIENNISALSKDCNLQSKTREQENYLMNNNTAREHDISMEMTSRLPILQTATKEFPPQTENNSNKFRQSRLDESNKEYQDISMDYTEPEISSLSNGNSKQLQSSNIQRNLSSRANKEENKFQRLTTDELQILCASLNLPTQKAEKEQSVISQNTQNFITDCNDVNVLRDSLKNKSNFQKSSVLSEGNKSFNIPSDVNSDFKICCDPDSEKKNVESFRLDVVRTVPSIMDFSTLDKSVANKSEGLQSDFNSSKTNILCKTMTIPITMEIDRTAEISLRRPELLEMSCSSTKVLPETNSMNKNNEFAKAPLIFNHKLPETAEIPMAESVVSAVHPTIEMSDRNSKVHLHNDISMEFSSTQPTSLSVKRKSSEKNQSPVSKKNFILHEDRSACTLESMNHGKENSDRTLKENSLNRMPSDSTDVLVATMGFKTELPHPLVINEKTTITVSTKSFSNKTYSIGVSSSIQREIQSDKTYVVNKMENQIELNCTKVDKRQQEDENINSEIPVVESNIEKNEELESDSDKENKEPKARESLFPEPYSEELEEIQPPSFLDSDSIQEESLDKREMQKDDLSDSVLNNSNKQQPNSFLHTEENKMIAELDKEQDHSSDVIRRLSNVDLNPPEEIQAKNKKQSKKKKVKKIENFEESPSKEVKQETVVPPTPFELLTENIKAHEKRDDCIWSIRSLNSNMIAADFISKSLIFVVRLYAFDVACNKDIENVQIISRLRPGTKNVLLKIVHNLLLAKLKPGELLEKYKMYEDVLPMLNYVSNEVIFAINFKLDIERLNATNVFNIDEERILFMVASKKTNIILKVSLPIKVFNEIRADDVHVMCILGDIRKNDIKQLIVNIKKDSKFLSRYINDVRDYITLMEESTCLSKH